MAYIGAEPLPGQNREVDDISSGFNGSTTAFTLQVSSVNVSPESANNILISLGGVIQNPGTDYTIAASTLTFTTAPASGLDFFGLILGAGINTATVADQTIGTSKILDNAVTADKLASGLSLTGDVSIADKIVHTGDTNTAIRFPAADTFTAETGGSERLRITSTGNVGIGTTNPVKQLVVMGTGDPTIRIQELASGAGKRLELGVTDSGAVGFIAANQSASSLAFQTVGSERMRIDSNGKVGIGTTTPEVMLDIRANDPGIQLVDTSGTNAYGNIDFVGDTLQLTSRGGASSDGFIDFRKYDGTTIDTTMRIAASGKVGIGTTSPDGAFRTTIQEGTSGHGVLVLDRTSNIDGTLRSMVSFERSGTAVGTITCSNSATAYNTSSDHRLKENVVTMSNATDRLKQLQPKRFNFILNPDTTVDGFLAHEVQSVVPEAISGTKDETQDILYTEEDTIPSGKKVGDVKETVPKYQGIDQSKLVPLLTAALQEAVTKIETLETKVAALEAA